MFRRMPRTDDDLPFIAVNQAALAVREPVIIVRQFTDGPAEVTEPRSVKPDLIRGQPDLLIEFNALRRGRIARIRGQQTAEKILAPGHEQRCAEFPAQPPGQARMIGMEVGAHDAIHGTPAHDLRKMLAPDFHAPAVADPRIHHHPAVPVPEQPEVDMVKA